ncbi:hypothetical protein PBCVAN69C_777L [Paramecium bursaria Chlorella virus AN69C]|uniref:Uncharacterized protein n=2 Tax=Chlorovirus TaxID=181083 RepID=O41168_PBCV1|nr:hypothetical protein PBCV1_A686L [Paramecium bursaria Chlorella virus 1]AAC96988.2 hypothetical protein [Paramecium bursaria Chlorella virus 1]AGE48662.1 hypothetical protein PBCVAN69C_777L [Paramecium bursaria Chlorella virus AN69C]AGE54069.1 hypothetical protein PBCVIL3A_764L [Paramecium bursaria Chlorella virus IL3A]AGE57498.1 hypothetical protein PBCVNEJV4_775L [Paramecium bursaria Chlorella virus NE-JV-4]
MTYITKMKKAALKWAKLSGVPTGYCIALSSSGRTNVNQNFEMWETPLVMFVNGPIRTFKTSEELEKLADSGVKVHPLIDNCEIFNDVKNSHCVEPYGHVFFQFILQAKFGCAFFSSNCDELEFYKNISGGTIYYSPSDKNVGFVIIPKGTEVHMKYVNLDQE